MTYRYPQSTQMCVATAVSSAPAGVAFARVVSASACVVTAGSAHATGGGRRLNRLALAPFGRLSPLPTPPSAPRSRPRTRTRARTTPPAVPRRAGPRGSLHRRDRVSRRGKVEPRESRGSPRAAPPTARRTPSIMGARLPFARHLRQSKSRLGFRDLGRRRLKRSVFVVPSKPSLSTTLLLVSRRSQRAPVKRST